MPTFYGPPSDGSGVPAELGEYLAIDLADPTSPLGAALVEALTDLGIRREPSINYAHWGDSMTGAGSSGNWVGKFATAVGHAAYNGGRGGETAQQIHDRMVGAEGEPYRNRRFTIEAGRNGFGTTAPETIVDLIHAMIRHLTVVPRGFVFDVPPWDTETLPAAAGSVRARLDELNGMLSEHFPDYYYPVFSLLRTDEAAFAAGITFTTQDRTDIANGVTPASFRTDGGHLNDKGGTAVAYFVQKEAHRRGLAATRPREATANTLTNYAVVPDPSANVGWTGSGGGVIPYSNAIAAMTYETVSGMDLPTAVRATGTTGMTGRAEVTVGRTVETRAVIPAAGGRVNLSAQVRASKDMNLTLRLRPYVDGAFTNQWGPVVAVKAGVPQRISMSLDFAAGTTNTEFAVIGDAGAQADGAYFDVTALMVTAGTSTPPYRDGNSAGWAWNGAAKQSTSTGPTPV